MARRRVPQSPLRYFNSLPEVIRLVVIMYVGALSEQMHRPVSGGG